MMQGKDVISSDCFKLKNENDELVSFNRQSITFRSSIKEISFLKRLNPKDINKFKITN